MYQGKTKDLRISCSTEKNVNVTGSKEAIINQVSCLLEQISRKYLLLQLGVDISNEMPESSVNYSKNKEIILGNAAKMGRKEKFSPNCTLFKGDIPSKKESLSIPPYCFNLLPLILDGKTSSQQILAGTKSIS